LYRVAQEALNNALKHAQARNIKVHLHQEQPPRGSVALRVADDGTGFDLVTARERGGMGLSAMEERAEELGGRWTVESAPGSGTRIILIWTGDEGGDLNE
jgi:signal transduction histidine kinase